MRTFKKTYRTKGGKQEARNYTVEFKNHDEKIVRVPAFADKASSETLGKRIERLVGYKGAREMPDTETQRWIKDMPPSLKARLIDIGLLDRKTAGAILTVYLSEWAKALSPAGELTKHARKVSGRAGRVFSGCGFITWQDIKQEQIEYYLKIIEHPTRGRLSPNTVIAYIKAIRQFCRWMVDTDRAGTNPIRNLKPPKRARQEMRAFDLDEFRLLAQATAAAPVRYSMTGYERSLIYRFAVMTGLRRNELKSVTVAALDLKGRTVFVKGDDTKNSDDAIQPFTDQMSQELERYIAGKMPSVMLFRIPTDSARMIQKDCKRAGVSVQNERGKITFHTLRHTCGTFLAAQGVHPKEIQRIMRHKDIGITMNRYCHTTISRVTAAVNKMPDLSAPPTQQQKATGTDGNMNLGARSGAQQSLQTATNCDKLRNSDNQNPDNTPKNAVKGGINGAHGTPTDTRKRLLSTNKALTEPDKNLGAQKLHADPDLQKLIDRWPGLTDESRAICLLVAGISA